MPRLHAAARMAIAELKRLKAVVNWAGPVHSYLAGQTSLADVLGLIASARTVVSNDFGLMHVAPGFGVSQVAVFGFSSPTLPLNARAQVLWLKNDGAFQSPLDCAPCFERECPLGHTRCLNDVLPERVHQAQAFV